MMSRRYLVFALKIAGDFGVSIAAPVVLLAWLGKKLDVKFGTWPYLTILGFAAAFLLSALALVKKAKKYGKEYKELGS